MQSEIDELRHRGVVYRLLASLWATELTDSTLQRLESADVRELWMSLGGHDPNAIRHRLEDLAEDYCRLFIGPTGHQPPVQSVWDNGSLQATSVASITEFATIASYESPWPSLVADHLANAFQLMAQLLAGASVETEPQRIRHSIELTESFQQQHVRWTAPYAEKIASMDGEHFYGRLAGITAEFVRLDMQSAGRLHEDELQEQLDDRVQSEPSGALQ